MYIPQDPFVTAAMLQNPATTKIKGVNVRKYSDVGIIKCSIKFFSGKSFDGKEKEINGVIQTVNTATVETWYRPDIHASSRLVIDGRIYELTGDPEDISMRHQFLKFRIREIKGGV